MGAAADGPLAVLVNPTAGRGRSARLLPDILARLGAAGHEVRLVEADTPAGAEAACHAAVADGVCALVAVGGDGTVHRALQAVAGRGVPFGIVPAGTGNDIATELGLAGDPALAASAAAQALAAGRSRAVDLAVLDGAGGQRRWYAAVLGAGFDAVVNERANRMRLPRGPRRYDLAILAELLRLRARRYTLRLDGVEHRVEAVLVAVANTASYGGGMRICPQADPHDGLLDVVVGGKIGRGLLLRLKPRLRTGIHVTHPLVSSFRARTVEVAGDGITAYVDGERAFALPVTVTSAPDALRLLAAPAAGG